MDNAPHPCVLSLKPLSTCRPLEVGLEYLDALAQMQQLLVLRIAQLVLISVCVCATLITALLDSSKNLVQGVEYSSQNQPSLVNQPLTCF